MSDVTGTECLLVLKANTDVTYDMAILICPSDCTRAVSATSNPYPPIWSSDSPHYSSDVIGNWPTWACSLVLAS